MLFKKILSLTFLIAFILTGISQSSAQSPDTLKLSFNEFLVKALDASAELKARQKQVAISQTRYMEARASRFLPNANATTAHGLIPGVKASNSDIPSDQLYLDPGLRNDWEDWAFFNQIEISALQPLYTWGALSNAIRAARTGVQAALHGFENDQRRYEFQMFQLYQAKLLSMEMERLINEANRTLDRSERELFELLESGEEDLDDRDVYQFEIFKYEFYAQADEIRENARFVERAWRLALGINDPNVIVRPEHSFLDAVDYKANELIFYQQYAISGRPEVLQIESARNAAEYGIKATRAQNYPALFLGITAKYTYAPNRPRQMNPFITNVTNTSSLTFGFGFRQNLNFQQMKSRTDRAREQLRQSQFALLAVRDGIRLEVADTYKSHVVARSRYENVLRALDISRQWLRQEQLDYDIGFGEILELVNALRTNLELEASHKQRTHDFNVSVARLLNTSGMSISSLFNQQNDYE